LATQIDLKQINDNQPLQLSRETNGVGASQAYDKAKGGVLMTVANAGNYCICQSKQWATYFSGKSHLIEITASNFQNEQVGTVKRMGYFSSSTSAPYDTEFDGVWAEADGTTYRLRISKTGTEILNVAKTDWNLYDESGDDWFAPDKFTVLVIDFLYLGGTAVRFGFIRNGEITWVHKYIHAGVVASTFVASPNQPLRWEIRGGGGASSMDQICGQVSSEGGRGEVGVGTSFWQSDFQADTQGTSYMVQAWRLKEDYRNITIDITDISVLAETNDDFRWTVSINSTIAGDALTFVDIDNSALQQEVGNNTNTTSPANFGKVIASGFVQGGTSESSRIKTKITIGTDIDGTSDIAYLHVTPVSNGLDIYSSVTLDELL